MPPVDRGRSRPKPKPKPKPRSTSRPRSTPTSRARAQENAYRSQGRAVERRAGEQRAAARRRPRSGAFGPPSFESPLKARQREAAKRSRRAAAKLPQHSRLPRLPVVRAPSGQRVVPPREARRFYDTVQREAREAGGLRKLWDASPPEDRKKLRLFALIRDAGRAEAMRGRAPSAPLRAAPPEPRIEAAGLSVNLDSVGDAIRNRTAFRHGAVTPADRLFVNAAKDLRDLGVAPFVGGYEVAASAYEAAAHNDLSRARRLAKGVAEGIEQSVPGQLVQGDLEGAGRSFREHPLFGLLDLGAVASIGGRTAGAVTRAVGSKPSAGGLRGALARGGSTVRPPIAMVDDAGAARRGTGLVERRYSKDLTRKAAQVAADARRRPLTDADGNVVTVMQRGREVPVLRAGAGERARHAKRAADFASSRANSVERLVRDQAAKEMKVRGVRGRRGRDLVAMVVEGTITSAKHMREDLETHARRIRALLDEHEELVRAGRGDESPYRHSGEVRAARARLSLVEEALGSQRVMGNAAKIVAAGEAIGRRLNEAEKEALSLGLLTPERAARARRVPAAIEHLGGRFFTERELRDLERQGVEVREPRGTAAHHAAREAVSTAREREATLADSLEQLLAKRQRMVGAQRVTRTRDAQDGPQRAYYVGERRFESQKEAAAYAKKTDGKVRSVALTGAEAKRTGDLDGLNRAIKAKRAELREARKRTREAEGDLDASPLPPLHEAVRGEDGRFLSNEQVDEFLRGRGRDPESVAFLPHRLDVRGRSAFHAQFRPGSRGTMERNQVRTGSGYARGVTESSAKLIQEQGVRQVTQINKARQLDRMIQDQGIAKGVREDGSPVYFTAKEAVEVAERALEDTGERLVPVRAFATKLDPEVQRVIREDLQGPGGMESIPQRLLNDRIVTGPDAKGAARAQNVVLVQADFIEQMMRHLRPAGSIQKFFQMVNRPFRFAVLAQPRWLTGNFVEPFFVRLPSVGSGVVNLPGLGMDVLHANRVIRRMERSGDPRVRAAAKEMRAHQEGGLFIGGRGSTVRRSLDELPMFNQQYGQMVARMPVVAQGIDLVRSIGRVLMAPGNVYFRINRAIERVAQDAAIGRELRRDIQEWSGSWLKAVRMQADALDEAARGLTGTSTQRRFMREQHKLLGKYEGFPPWLREIVQGPMPFLPWALNAARFVYWTMPAERTALTAALLKVQDVVAKDWEELHKNTPPGGLRFAIPTKKGGWIDLARYTPYGLTAPATEGELEGLNQVAPQFQGPAYALFLGADPFGRPLQMSDGQPAEGLDRVKVALNSLLESGAPYVGQTRRVLEGGGTGFSDSTVVDPQVKPGTDHMSGLRRTLDPFRPTYLRSPGGAGEVSSSAPPITGDDLDAQIDRALRAIDEAEAGADPLDAEIQRALEQLP